MSYRILSSFLYIEYSNTDNAFSRLWIGKGYIDLKEDNWYCTILSWYDFLTIFTRIYFALSVSSNVVPRQLDLGGVLLGTKYRSAYYMWVSDPTHKHLNKWPTHLRLGYARIRKDGMESRYIKTLRCQGAY